MVITKARAMTFGLGGKLKLFFIKNALISLFIYVLLYKVIESVICTLYKVIKVESVMASLWELGPVIFGPTEDFVSFLQNKGLLASSRTCSSCSGAVMRLSVMVVYGDVPSARRLRVSVREVVLQSPGCL